MTRGCKWAKGKERGGMERIGSDEWRGTRVSTERRGQEANGKTTGRYNKEKRRRRGLSSVFFSFCERIISGNCVKVIAFLSTSFGVD